MSARKKENFSSCGRKAHCWKMVFGANRKCAMALFLFCWLSFAQMTQRRTEQHSADDNFNQGLRFLRKQKSATNRKEKQGDVE